jgi:2-polyprenyl-3-methyl-5-hydroxy-6-metoxy-1,4-benzoquinol methylase
MKVDKNILVKIFGFRATLLHGDPLIMDRWRFVKRRLPRTANMESLIDIGCGSGAFTIGAALRGYKCIGLSWDERNQEVARQRAAIVRAVATEFPVQDARQLHKREEWIGRFDVALCLENIEHIIDDRKLMRDISSSLKPGGYLLLTTPNYFYRAITSGDEGPFILYEDGGHVRRGYTPSMLRELCNAANLDVDEITYCSGFFSQKVCTLFRRIRPLYLAWILTLPLRVLPPLLDPMIAWATKWPYFSICLVAVKPRFDIDHHR